MHHFLVGVFSRQISLCRNFHSKVGVGVILDVGVISVEYGIVRMRTQSHVCENPFCEVCIDPGNPNPGKPQCLPRTYRTLFSGMLFSEIINARLRIYFLYRQCLCLVIYPWHYSLTGSAKYFSNCRAGSEANNRTT